MCASFKKLIFLSCLAFVNTTAFSKVSIKLVQANPKATNSSSKHKNWKARTEKDNKTVQYQKMTQTQTDKNNPKMPQQGGLPEFQVTENFQTIRGEAEGAGDTPVIEERGGMPEFDISGYVSFYPIIANPNITYHDGKGKNSIIPEKPNFLADTIDLKSTSKTKMDDEGLGFVAGEAGLTFDAHGTFDNGLKYGGNINIQVVKSDIDIDKIYASLEHKKFGQLFMGNLKGPDSVFNVGGQSLIGGCGGINGAILANLDYSTAVPTARAMIGDSNKSTKMVFFTPKFAGFQVGMGFTPDTKHHGHDIRDRNSGDSSNGNNPGLFRKGDDDKERPSGKNNFAIGLRFEHELAHELTLRAAAAFVTEKTQKLKTSIYDATEIVADEKDNKLAKSPESKEIELNNAKSYQFSLGLTFRNITVAGGYFNSGKSRLPTESMYKSSDGKSVIIPGFMCDKDGNAGRGWNIGARIDWKKLALAAVYHRTWRNVTKDDKAVGNVVTVTADYLIKPSFKIFAEFDYVTSKSCDYACNLNNINMKNKSAIAKQSGTILAAGATVQF